MTRQPSPHNEVEGAVAKIYDEPEREHGEPYVNASSVPKFDPERRAAVIAHYPRAYRQIAASSPLESSLGEQLKPSLSSIGFSPEVR